MGLSRAVAPPNTPPTTPPTAAAPMVHAMGIAPPAPTDWASAKNEPATTFPMADWVAAAAEPALHISTWTPRRKRVLHAYLHPCGGETGSSERTREDKWQYDEGKYSSAEDDPADDVEDSRSRATRMGKSAM